MTASISFYWIFYLHFKCCPLSWFPLHKPPIPFPLPPATMRVFPHPLLPHRPGIPLHWDIEPTQDQGPPLLLMPDKAILCYICIWSHGSLSTLLGWWSSPWEHWVVWPVNVVFPVGSQNPPLFPLCYFYPTNIYMYVYT